MNCGIMGDGMVKQTSLIAVGHVLANSTGMLRRVEIVQLPTPPSFCLGQRRALVVGASSGIGLGCAVALADAGAHVTLAARRADQLQELAGEFTRNDWPTAVLTMDVADVDATRKLVSDHGPFDILVNSAGLARHGPASGTTEADFDAVMAVNLRGAYFLTQAVANGLVAAGKPGSLITISSQMGLVGGGERAVYCASKFAVEGFTKAMAIEFAPHDIRINTVCPTFIRTALTAGTLAKPDRMQWIREKIKLNRIGEVEDVMGAVLYLASPASAMVTGTALRVDGGWTAG